MKTKIPYDDLHLLPSVIAENVCRQEYTGKEFSANMVSPSDVKKVEAKRQQMTEDQINEFANKAELMCKTAYEKNKDWFMDIVNAKGNKGRDQLYVFVSHWLSGFLTKTKIEA